jgi:hypothetical protein
VADVDLNNNIELAPLTTEYVIVAGISNATLLAPAVASPIFTVELAGCENVPVKPVKLSERQFTELVSAATVQVTAPEAASKNTSSAAVGTAEPPPPPEVVAHFVPTVVSQVAVPPTQYLLAIC